MPASRADWPFRFAHRWSVSAEAAAVLALLADPVGYPAWWPAIPSARRIDDDRARILLRGLVPVRLVMRRVVDDRATGRLVARLDGDLVGDVVVMVRQEPSAPDAGRHGPGPRCVVVWRQDVVLGTRWMRAVARVPGARAAMRLSHAAAMRSARRALGATALPATDDE